MLLFFMLPNVSKACLDPDTTVIVTVNYDTLDTSPCPTAKEVEIRISNIRMMNEDPNKVCACALASTSGLFTDIIYIAFVDSGTNNPYKGFGKFNENAKSSQAWKSKYSAKGDWSGFVATVLNSGLKSQDPVELIIRAKAPNNTQVVFNDSLCNHDLSDYVGQSSLGTDEWDAVKEELKEGHQKVRGLPVKTESFEQKTKKHFEDLDDEIITKVGIGAVWILKENEVEAYPNPTDGNINLAFDMVVADDVTIKWVDMAGKETLLRSTARLDRGEHILTFNLSEYNIHGIGTLHMVIGNNTTTKRITSH